MKRNHNSQTTDKSPMPRDARRHMRATTGLVLYIEEVLYGNYVLTWFDSWCMVLKCQTFMITTFRPYILHKLERFILYIPIKWNPNSLPVNLCLSFLFLKGIFIKTKTVYLLISRQSRQLRLEFLVLTVYCFRDWVSVFGFQFLNLNEMIERRARKDSPL